MGRAVRGTLMATGSTGGVEKSHRDVTCSGHGPFQLTDGEARGLQPSRGEERLSRLRLSDEDNRGEAECGVFFKIDVKAFCPTCQRVTAEREQGGRHCRGSSEKEVM